MKSIIITIITMLCVAGHDASAQRLRIGHRDANQVAVLDIGISYIQPTIVQELTLLDFTNIRVTSLDISDNAFNPFYYASIGITVEYQELGSTDILKLSFLYPIVYDASMNAYYGGVPEFPGIKSGGASGGSGGNDTKNCAARNCVGCGNIKDQDGHLIGCKICIPVNIDKDFSCVVENTSGTGGGLVLNALGGILKGLIVLF